MQFRKISLLTILLLLIPSVFLSAQQNSENQNQFENASLKIRNRDEQNQISENQNPQDSNLESANSQNQKSDDESNSQISPNLKVTKINFSGLKKTKDFYIQSKVKKFLNSSVQDFDMHGLETTLQLEELFDDIQISMQDSGAGEANVEISVKEKITFIPLPFAAYSDSEFMAGVMVMDTNAFGIKDMFLFGGLYSPGSLMGIAVFSQPPKPNGIPGFSVSVSTSKSTTTLENLENDDVLEYDSIGFSSWLLLTEQIGEYNSITLGGFFQMINADQVDGYDEVDDLKSAGISASYGISKSDWNGWFMSNSGAEISGGINLYASNSDYKNAKTLSANLRLEQPIIDRMRLYSLASAFYGDDKQHISSYVGGGAGAVTILPGNFKTRQIAGANAGLELAFVKGKIGILSVYADYQAVSAQDFDDEFCFMHGPNGGIRFYLAKIAFPALALGFSYNVTKHYAQFAAAFGVSM